MVWLRQADLRPRRQRHRRPAVRPHRDGRVRVLRSACVLVAIVDQVHLATPHAAEHVVANRVGFARDQRQQRSPVRAMLHIDVEQVDERREDVRRRRQRRDPGRLDARPRDHQRDVAQRLVRGHAGLAPDVLLAQVVTVVRADDDGRVLPEAVALDRVHHLAEPGVDHRQLAAVGGPDLVRLALVEHALLQRAANVGRPDQVRPLPRVVVHRRVRLRRVERLVRVELVDEEEEAVVVAGVVVQPRGRRCHRLRAGEVLLLAEVPARVVVGHECPSEHRRAYPAIVRTGLPGIALVAALVVPGVEVGVVVLAARLEEVRVVGHKLRRDALPAQQRRQRLLPQLDRAPGLPKEVQRAAE